jgi:hypothetical protein
MTTAPPDAPDPSPPRWRAADVAALLGCAAVGLALTTLPHWRACAETGSLPWVADHDELDFYLPMGARAYHEHPARLADPATASGETYYQSLPAAPGVLAARAAGSGPFSVGFWWRAVGGAAVGAAWFWFARLFLGTGGALAAAAVLTADPGTAFGQPLYSLAARAAEVLRRPAGELLPGALYGVGPAQCRILNPVLAWPWWLLFLGLLQLAVRRPTRARVAAAGAGLGLLFYVYFYLWTAGGLGLGLAALLDRRSARVYLAVGAVGLVLGLPALADGMLFKERHGTDWMERTDKFVPVPRGSELLAPKLTIGVAAAVWAWVALRRRDLIGPAAIATAGLLLLNQHVVTGRVVENFHWNFAFGPILAVLTVLLAADLVGRWRPAGRWAGGVVAVGVVAVGAWLYAATAARCREPIELNTQFREYLARDGPVDLTSGVAVAGEPTLVSLATAEFNLHPLAGYAAYLSPIPNRELDERTALNSILLDRPRAEFEADRRAALAGARWSPATRSEEYRHRRLAEGLAAFDDVARDVPGVVARYGVRYLIVPPTHPVGPDWEPAAAAPGWVAYRYRK